MKCVFSCTTVSQNSLREQLLHEGGDEAAFCEPCETFCSDAHDLAHV